MQRLFLIILLQVDINGCMSELHSPSWDRRSSCYVCCHFEGTAVANIPQQSIVLQIPLHWRGAHRAGWLVKAYTLAIGYAAPVGLYQYV